MPQDGEKKKMGKTFAALISTETLPPRKTYNKQKQQVVALRKSKRRPAARFLTALTTPEAFSNGFMLSPYVRIY